MTNEMKNENESTEDEIVGEIHRVRAELLSEHGGSLGTLIEHLRSKQEESGKKVIERLNPPPGQLKAG